MRDIQELERRILTLEAESFALQQQTAALLVKQKAHIRALRFWIPVALLMGATAAALYLYPLLSN